MNATYSPEDNKLRLYSEERLDTETYQKARSLGFIYAPKQKLFVAPMWTPSREDFLIELCGEIGDEDTSLMERQEERAERFENYSDKRADEAELSYNKVEEITSHIPFCQPILIGHRSERKARKEAQKIENEMRYAVKMWDASEYWKERAQRAIRHAKYKELPSVRARRIKKLEAEQRKFQRSKAEAENLLKLWNKVETAEHARIIAGRCRGGYLTCVKNENHTYSAYDVLQPDETRYSACPSWTLEQVKEVANKTYPAQIGFCNRWINHYKNRLTYEETMLKENGGIESDKITPEVGGACKCWATPRDAFSYIIKVNKVSVTVLDNWGNGGGNFTRNIPFDKLAKLMSKKQVEEARAETLLVERPDKTCFYLKNNISENITVPENKYLGIIREATTEEKDPIKDKIEDLKETLKSGVQVVVSEQLFPTPPAIAERMVKLLEVVPGMDILEPSAGTGNLIKALPNIRPNGSVTAVEINYSLSQKLNEWADFNINKDFLECNGELGLFDRIIMNPPFKNAEDIKHIKHAINHLKPSGILVALCANGSRQQEALKPLAEYWEVLPAGSFKEAGTNVNVALMIIRN